MASTRIVLIRHGESQAHGRPHRLRARHVHRACPTSAAGKRRSSATGCCAPASSATRLPCTPASCPEPSRRRRRSRRPSATARSTRLEHCDWCEQHPGEGEGLPFDEYDERYGVFNEGEDRSGCGAPGSESVDMFVRAGRGRVGARGRRARRRDDRGRVSRRCDRLRVEVLGGVPFGSLVRYVENTSITELRPRRRRPLVARPLQRRRPLVRTCG